MEGLFVAFMVAVVGLLWSISSDVKQVKQQLTVEAYERNGFFKKPSKHWKSKCPEVTQPIPKVGEAGGNEEPPLP